MNNSPTPPSSLSTSKATTTIQERLAWRITPELHETIRRLWIKHSIAEDNRDLQGLIDTLTDDCVYEIPVTGQRWEGHDGARLFYTTFLGAFPDAKFDLTDIVIGPQGVFEVAQMTGTHLGPWAGLAASGKPVRTTVIIFFPWEPAAAKFAGEKIYLDQAAFGNKAKWGRTGRKATRAEKHLSNADRRESGYRADPDSLLAASPALEASRLPNPGP